MPPRRARSKKRGMQASIPNAPLNRHSQRPQQSHPSKTTLPATLTVPRSLTANRPITEVLPLHELLDRVRFSADTRIYSPRGASLPTLPPPPCGYRCSGGALEDAEYRRFLKFSHLERADAPVAVFLYEPRRLPAPLFQLQLTAPWLPYVLTELTDVRDIVEHVTSWCGEALTLSECEVTVEFIYIAFVLIVV